VLNTYNQLVDYKLVARTLLAPNMAAHVPINRLYVVNKQRCAGSSRI